MKNRKIWSWGANVPFFIIFLKLLKCKNYFFGKYLKICIIYRKWCNVLNIAYGVNAHTDISSGARCLEFSLHLYPYFVYGKSCISLYSKKYLFSSVYKLLKNIFWKNATVQTNKMKSWWSLKACEICPEAGISVCILSLALYYMCLIYDEWLKPWMVDQKSR